MIRFEYKREADHKGGSIWRPVADVWFKTSSGEWIELHPYIDSGADITLVPYSFGKLIGLKKTFFVRKEKIGGIGGKMDVIFVKTDMKIGNKIITASVGWAQSENVPALLGRAEIFDQFEIIFKQKRKEVIFQD